MSPDSFLSFRACNNRPRNSFITTTDPELPVLCGIYAEDIASAPNACRTTDVRQDRSIASTTVKLNPHFNCKASRVEILTVGDINLIATTIKVGICRRRITKVNLFWFSSNSFLQFHRSPLPLERILYSLEV